MSGHSKWATTKRHKAVVDAKRGKIFSVISKEITIAAKGSGGDPEMNPRLRTLILKAKGANMPADNIDRAIKKGTGELPGVIYEEFTYEGYGPGGIGVLVEVTTDNKNRSAADVRSTFSKYGGNLAGAGAVAFNFQKQGQFLIAGDKTSEEQLMDIVLEAGAEDILDHQDHFEVRCPVHDYDTVSQALEKAEITVDSSELAYIPNNTMVIDNAKTASQALRLIDMLDEIDDVKSVFANYEIDAKILDAAKE